MSGSIQDCKTSGHEGTPGGGTGTTGELLTSSPTGAESALVKIKILAFGDSPTRMTGFGRVLRNVLGRWQQGLRTTDYGECIGPSGAEMAAGARPPLRTTGGVRLVTSSRAESTSLSVPIDGSPIGTGGSPVLPICIHCWGIGYDGWPHEHPYLIFPGGKHDWNTPARLSHFLKVLAEGDYTHLFLLMDPDALSVHDRTSAWNFPQRLRQVCKSKNIRVLLYYPVDAPLEREWLTILDAADVAVTYTEYGREQTRAALAKSRYPIEVVPHGVDECFRSLPIEERLKARKIELVINPRDAGPESRNEKAATTVIDFVDEDTFLILGVNKNEHRKDPLRMLEILAGLRRLGLPAKLLLRMDPMSAMGGIHLDLAAKQLGLTYGVEWCHIGSVMDEGLVALYNAADLYLTTSLGEGWGLGVTEAMACHTPVAMPRHTSLAEIGEAQSRNGESRKQKSEGGNGLVSPRQPSSGLRPPSPAPAGEGQGPIWLPQETGAVCGADTRLRHRVDLTGAVDRIHRDYGSRCGQGVRHAPTPGVLQTWDSVADRLWSLLVGGERELASRRCQEPAGGDACATGKEGICAN